jgi:hypothetical protein
MHKRLNERIAKLGKYISLLSLPPMLSLAAITFSPLFHAVSHPMSETAVFAAKIIALATIPVWSAFYVYMTRVWRSSLTGIALMLYALFVDSQSIDNTLYAAAPFCVGVLLAKTLERRALALQAESDIVSAEVTTTPTRTPIPQSKRVEYGLFMRETLSPDIFNYLDRKNQKRQIIKELV